MNVINRNEDFYKVIEEGRVFEYDVFLINLLYFVDYIEKCVMFVVENFVVYGCLYMLFLFLYVIYKDYYLFALFMGGSRGKEKVKLFEFQCKDEENNEDDVEENDDGIKCYGGGVV